jgi:alkanesulfonate monooxygenase SsuD/methylene tetrahydromethanopterin reductase-like flavin-dependent oxidoreductase (luciferase family)
MAAIALRYDLRSPEWAATKHPELYQTCLEQVAWAEQNNVADIVVLSEHHGLPDGFMPSPFVVAAAICGKTDRIPVSIAAVIVALHDPIRLAEQIATADLIGRGRVSFVVGIGYAQHEFEMAGVDRKKRGRLTEEYIEVMRKAWMGEPFEYAGRTVRVTPKPFSQPNPPLFLGGGSEAAARRAARLRVGFLPSIGDPALKEIYEEECARVGYEGFCILPTGPGFVLVSEDPDKTWEEIKRYAWFDADTYRNMQTVGNRSQVTTAASNPDELRREGIYRVVTPDECVTLVEELGPMGTMVLHPLMCGIPVEIGWQSLELFKDKVLPTIRPGP